MYADSVFIYVRHGHELTESCHLVFHFCLSALFMDGFLVFCAMTFCTSVVLDVNDVAALCHVHFPKSSLTEPAVVHELEVWSTVYVKYYRIFLCRVEAVRKDESEVVVEFAVAALYCSEDDFSGLVFFKRIFCCEECTAGLSVCRAEFYDCRDIYAAVAVDEPGAVVIDPDIMPTVIFGESHWGIGLYGAFA